MFSNCFQKKKLNKKRFIGEIMLVFLLIILFVLYSMYEEKKAFDSLAGNVSNCENTGLSFVVDGVPSDTMPSKDSGKAIESIECDHDAMGYWDYDNWSIIVTNLSRTRTKCSIHFKTKYSENLLNGTDPVLKDELIPVEIDESGRVTRARLGYDWYKYEDKKWANAVILEDESKIYYEGEEIPENAIESYFVWIPRYKYKIFNEGDYEGLTSVEKREKIIEVEFESKDMSVSNGSKVGEWLTHPAFTSFDVNGMWVGKFETGYKGATTNTEAQQNVVDVDKVQIKPNVYSWREIQVGNAHLNSYNYKRHFDSHLMKNTEWGAVAYLQHSAYGSQQSVRINNNGSSITGYAAVKEPACGYSGQNEACNISEKTALGVDGINTMNYKNSNSVVASTTGNYSGIYDMSGGAWEYVMGVMLDKNGNLSSGRSDQNHSNFIGTLTYPEDGINKSKTHWTEADGGIPYPESKYYNLYAYGEDDGHYNRRILGDATGELGPFANVTYGTQQRRISSWYGDGGWFLRNGWVWYIRGGEDDYGSDSGIFDFGNTFGHAGNRLGYRIILSF